MQMINTILPMIAYSFADSAEFLGSRVGMISAFVIVLIVPVYNVSAVVILLASQRKLNRVVMREEVMMRDRAGEGKGNGD